MSLKAIELQVAIPRTQTAGKLQDQLQQRGQVVQDHIAVEQQKDDEKKRKNVVETTEAEKKRLNNDDESSRGQENPQMNKKQKTMSKQANQNSAQHPYKGNFVDFSG